MYVPSSLTAAGERSESGSNILARRLFGKEVRVALVVSNFVPPTFNLILSFIF